MEIKGIDVEDAKDHTYNFKIGNYCTCQPSTLGFVFIWENEASIPNLMFEKKSNEKNMFEK